MLALLMKDTCQPEMQIRLGIVSLLNSVECGTFYLQLTNNLFDATKNIYGHATSYIRVVALMDK